MRSRGQGALGRAFGRGGLGAGAATLADLEALRTDLTLSGVQSGQVDKTFGVDTPPTGVNVTATVVTVTSSFTGGTLSGWDFEGRELIVQAGASVITENCLWESAGFGSANFEFVDVADGGSYGARYCTYRGHPAHSALASAVKWRPGSTTLGITERNRYLEMPNDCYKPHPSERIEWCYFGFLKHVPAGALAWSSLTTYAAGDIVRDGAGFVFMSLVGSNLNNALPAYDPGGSSNASWQGLTPHGDNITIDAAADVRFTNCLIDNTTEPPETVPDATVGDPNPLGVNNSFRIKRNTPDTSVYGAVTITSCATYRGVGEGDGAAMASDDGGKADFRGPIRVLNSFLSKGASDAYVFPDGEWDVFSGCVDYTSGDPIIVATRTLAAPVNTVLPAITGTATVGEELSVADGTWTGQPIPAFTYQWLRDGADIAGATASAYTLVEADAETSVSCRVTGTNTQGAASATSATSAAVAALVYGNETVSGTPLATNAPASRKLAFIGDSRVEGNLMGQFAANVAHALGEWCWIQLDASGLFENNYGDGGSTIFNAANTQAPAAVAAGAKTFIILTGTNGARKAGEGDAVDDLATRQEETLNLLSALDVVDGTIFLCNEVPGSTGGTSGAVKFAHHEWLNGLTTANTSLVNAELVIVNTWDATVDPATSGAATELHADWINDGLHPSDRGQEFMAKAVWTAANAHFTQPHLDFSSPDQLLLDGTTTATINRGVVPTGFTDFTATDALTYATSGTGANTVLTVTNTGGSNLSMSLRRTPAATTDAVVLVEYDMDDQPGAATTAGTNTRQMIERFSIRNFDHGSGLNRANVNTPTQDATLTSQLQYLGGRRRVCYNLGASAASPRLDITFQVPPGRVVRFHRLDIYER